MAKQSLVIVESPAKAKTIGKYLGKNYEVKACMGHLRDLQKSNLSVDVDNDFEPVYKPIKGKEAIISDLKKSAKAADTVYLATDPDREGEAISWHLKSLLDLPDKKTKRVTFNEITKNVVRQSIESPRDIDQNLVDAQQARRILDRLVGYQLSPLLWKKIKRGLSAGRVQSVATRMVDDRDREIENFKPEEYWTLDAVLTGNDAKKLPFSARYHGKSGKKGRAEVRRRGGGCGGGDKKRRLCREIREADGQEPLSVPALYHLHHAAGGQPEAVHDPPPHHGHRPAAL